jgi:hypothetical protein
VGVKIDLGGMETGVIAGSPKAEGFFPFAFFA